MLQTIVPKSDQLNSDDLIGRTLTIKVTEVRFKGNDEQPVSIHYEGDEGKPYKACKSMRRVMVHVWGADANKYVGRSMTLCRDPKVTWAGQAVGGIRISHMSDITEDVTMALTATRQSRKPFTVKPLIVQAAQDDNGAASLLAAYERCAAQDEFDKLEKERGELWESLGKSDKMSLKTARDAAAGRLTI